MEPFRLELPTGLQVGSVNAYLFTDPEPILIDTGIKRDESWQALEEGLAEHGLAVVDLSRVIITHAHVDHYGQAGAIAAGSDADIWISQLGVPWLEEREEIVEQRERFYGEYFLPSIGLSAEAMEMVRTGFLALSEQSHPIPASRIRPFRPDGKLQMGGRTWKCCIRRDMPVCRPASTNHRTGSYSRPICCWPPHQHLS